VNGGCCFIERRGDDESLCPTHERNPVVFAVVSSVLIPEWDRDSELAIKRIARPHGERRNRKNGVSGIRIISLPSESRIGIKNVVFRNRWNYHAH
jgi:hypothetical protein